MAKNLSWLRTCVGIYLVRSHNNGQKLHASTQNLSSLSDEPNSPHHREFARALFQFSKAHQHQFDPRTGEGRPRASNLASAVAWTDGTNWRKLRLRGLVEFLDGGHLKNATKAARRHLPHSYIYTVLGLEGKLIECQIVSFKKPAHIFCNTRTIPSIGTPGARKHCKKQKSKTSRSFLASVTPRAIGAT